MTENRRIFGITVLSIGVTLLGAVLLYSTYVFSTIAEKWNEWLSLSFGLGAGLLICGIFMWMLKNWARIVFIILMLEIMITGIVMLFSEQVQMFVIYSFGLAGFCIIVGIILIIAPLILVIYLTRPGVSARFKK